MAPPSIRCFSAKSSSHPCCLRGLPSSHNIQSTNSTYYELVTVSSALHIFTHLIFTTNLKGKCSYAHPTDEETEAQGGEDRTRGDRAGIQTCVFDHRAVLLVVPQSDLPPLRQPESDRLAPPPLLELECPA